MDVMEKVALRHKFKVLLHEKPFAGVNGSGKHNNWSLITNTGTNLLAPTANPESNLQFLSFFVNVIKAVHDHADLLRASIASAGNEHRLGANEAPPAIMSIFIGSQMTEVLEGLLNNKTTGNTNKAGSINVKKIPDILLDNTDRNRTSPFAFTGNKFEFRAVGSSANSANAMIVMNTIMADQLIKFKTDSDALIKKGKKKDEAILEVLKGYYKSSKKILFEGNGYGDEWVKEAAKRGLNNIKSTPEALNAYISKSSRDLFVRNEIFNAVELDARYEIMQELYVKKIDIEAKLMAQLATSHVIPAAIAYQRNLAENVKAMKDAGLSKSDTEVQVGLIKDLGGHIKNISIHVTKLLNELEKAHHLDSTHKSAVAFSSKIKPLFDPIRKSSDALEFLVDDELWKLPKYREMLFVK
jgi:glutamine synthetase